AVFSGHTQALVGRETGTRRNEATHDDVLFDSSEIVRLSVNGGLGEYLGRFLEGRCTDERLCRKRRLGDPQEHRFCDSWTPTTSENSLVLDLEHELLDLFVGQEVRVPAVLDAYATQHLTHDGLDVLVVDGHTLQAVHLLDLVHEPSGELLLTLHAQNVVGVCRTVLKRIARADMVTWLYLDVLALGDQILARLIREQVP